MYRNLSEFIARLEREGELVRIGAAVSPAYEIAEITDRMCKSPDGGKALLNGFCKTFIHGCIPVPIK